MALRRLNSLAVVLSAFAVFSLPLSIEAAPIVFTDVVSSADPRPGLVGTIAGMPGQSVQISFIGIGGDADAGSGDTVFQALGGGLNFTWAAGQMTTPATHRLSPTPPAVGAPTTSGRGFSFLPVSYVAAPGASVDIHWLSHFDFDGRYTFGTDLLGNSYNDSAIISSVRPWLQYEYVADVSAIPEPMSIVLVGTGLAGMTLRRHRRNRNVANKPR